MGQIDTGILMWIQENLRYSAVTPFWKTITFLGNSGWFWILISILLICIQNKRSVGVTAVIPLIIKPVDLWEELWWRLQPAGWQNALAFSTGQCYTKKNTLIKCRGILWQKKRQPIWK